MTRCCPPIRRMDYGPECTRELVEEVAKQLATRSVRDSDFILANSIDEDDNVAIVQNGVNKRISLNKLADSINTWLNIDAIKDKLDTLNIEYNTTEYWNSKTGYVPPAGAIIIYSDYEVLETPQGDIVIPGIKIGSGNGYVQDLTFIGGESSKDILLRHINNTDIHVTLGDKARWDGKLNIDDEHEVVDETLIFIRDNIVV